MEFLLLFGARIKFLREQLGLTQEQLAELMDISATTIARVEKGRKFLHPDSIIKLKKALKVSYGQLFDVESVVVSKENEKLIDKTIKRFKKLDERGLKFIASVVDDYLKTH